MSDKRFRVVVFTRQEYENIRDMSAAFENFLNQMPSEYTLHSWTFNPATPETHSAYRAVIEIAPEVVKEPASGRKFRHKGE